MKFTRHGARNNLTTIIVFALACVSCNSETVAEETMLEDVEISQSAPDASCLLDFAGVEVDTSLLDTSNGLVGEFGGLCKLSNTVLASAADIHSASIRDGFCSPAQDAADAIGQGDMGQALIKIRELVAQGRYDESQSEELQLAFSLCGDESVLAAAVEEYLRNTDINVFSVGTAEHGDVFCPTIVWSLSSEQQGQSYNVTGLGRCSDITLPHKRLFNPERNPDGQLPGDYIRQVLGYNGALPGNFEYKGSSYRFVSEETLMEADGELLSKLTADRSVLGKDSEKYIYWSSGDKDIDNEYLAAAEVLTLQYHSDELQYMQPQARALSALHTSYGAPSISEVRQVIEGNQPGVHATVTTSSGDQFVMIVDPATSVSESELVEWLPKAHPELLVVQGEVPELEDKLSLFGALFTDGKHTFLGKLQDCECEEQGVLGWSAGEGETFPDSLHKLEMDRKDFIARLRSEARYTDWTFSTETHPRAIAYVLSNYSQISRDRDAALVVQDRGRTHTLYVAMDLTCKDESLLFSFGKKSLNVDAHCREIDSQGVAFTVSDRSGELALAMRRGLRMNIGLVGKNSKIINEEYEFSLLGASGSLDELDVDETDFSERVVEFYSGISLSEDSSKKVFELLRKRPVYCRSGASPPECVVEKAVPKVAAAKPSKKRVARYVEPADFAMDYAVIIAEQIGSGDHPECEEVVSQIMNEANSIGTSELRAQQIERMVGRAPNICFNVQ